MLAGQKGLIEIFDCKHLPGVEYSCTVPAAPSHCISQDVQLDELT